MNKLEIRTGHFIYWNGEDVKEHNKKMNYNDASTKKRKDFELKKWVSVESLNKWIDKRVKEMSEQYKGCFTNHGKIPRELQKEIANLKGEDDEDETK